MTARSGANLDGKVAIVTGGARGMGRSYAHGLATAGAAVLIADLLEEEGRQTAKAIEADGGRAVYMAVDVTDADAAVAMAATAASEFGGVERSRQAASALGMEGTSWDIAWAIEYLVSDRARWVSGATLPVDSDVLCTSYMSMQPIITRERHSSADESR